MARIRLRSGSGRRAIHCVAFCLAAASAVGWAQAPSPAAVDAAATVPSSRNVYAGGGQVRPAAAVEGDFTAAGGKVVVDQPVQGDASLAGGSVDVRASVGDDLRAVGGDVTIESTVGGELFATGGNITLTPAAAVARGATLYGGNVTIDGRVDGGLVATAQKVTINAEVRGDVRVVAEQVELGPNARIAGRLDYVSPAELKKAEGATVTGPVRREPDTGVSDGRPGGTHWQWQRSVRPPAWAPGLMSYLALLLVAAVFLLPAPSFGTGASGRIAARPGTAFAAGLAAVFLLPMVAVTLVLTILGIPLALALLAVYPVLLLLGFLVGVLFVARTLPPLLRVGAPQGIPAAIGYYALTLLVVLLASRIPVLGGLLAGALAVAGVGGVVLEVHGRLRPGASSPGHDAAALPAPAH